MICEIKCIIYRINKNRTQIKSTFIHHEYFVVFGRLLICDVRGLVKVVLIIDGWRICFDNDS